MNRREVGGRKEALAAEYLESEGYRIRERNFRCRQGEIDLIAEEDGYLVFVEVKYRADGRSGEPEEAVGYAKQNTLRKTARYYLYRNGLPEETRCRFDVVGIRGDAVRVIRNAF